MRMMYQIASAPTRTEPTTMMAIKAGFGRPPDDDDELLPSELSAAFEPEADAAEDDAVEDALEESPELADGCEALLAAVDEEASAELMTVLVTRDATSEADDSVGADELACADV